MGVAKAMKLIQLVVISVPCKWYSRNQNSQQKIQAFENNFACLCQGVTMAAMDQQNNGLKLNHIGLERVDLWMKIIY
jgi:hypothetical protein